MTVNVPAVIEPPKRKLATHHKRKHFPLAVDETALYDLAKIHCTMEEMSAIVGLTVDDLYKTYGKMIEVARQEGKASLRRQMYLEAMKGNITMMIWLSKQALDMRDRHPDEATQIVFNVKLNEVPI